MTTPLSGPSLLAAARRAHGRRLRLAISLTLYAGALGAAVVLISLLTRTKPWVEPEHLSFAPSVFLSLGGALAGILIVWPLAYWFGDGAGAPRGLLAWLAVGFGFGVLLPLLTGAFLPLSIVFVDLSLGVISAGQLFSSALDALFRAPLSLAVHGALGIFTGLLAGALFGTGAWVVDMVNASSNPVASRYGPWAIALLLGSIAVVIAVFGPADTLAKLG